METAGLTSEQVNDWLASLGEAVPASNPDEGAFQTRAAHMQSDESLAGADWFNAVLQISESEKDWSARSFLSRSEDHQVR